MFTPEQIKELQAPLNKKHVKGRSQAGRTLSYVEGWHVIDEANRIFGFDGWTRETLALNETSRDLVTIPAYRDKPAFDQWRVSYVARVRINVGGVVRDGTGYGSGMAKPEALGDAIESAAKEAETDAMKRALMTFGNPFGLALYDKDQANVCDDAAVAKSKATDTPDDERASKYIDLCMKAIENATSATAVADWWEAEADHRREYKLTEDEVQGLKKMAIARRKALNTAKEPA